VRRKTLLLASVAALVVVAAEPSFAEGFYFSTSGGANFMRDRDGTFTTDFVRGGATYDAHYDFQTGFLLSSAIGLELDHWLRGLRVELEASYRRNKLDGHWSVTTDNPDIVSPDAVATGAINGHASTFALMANAWYEFDIGTRFKPYVGGGMGWARSQIDGGFAVNPLSVTALDVNPFEGFNVQSQGFAYQLGAGITSQIMPGVSLGLGYRYFDAPDTEIFFAGKFIGLGDVSPAASSNNSIKFDNVSHSVALTLTVDIN